MTTNSVQAPDGWIAVATGPQEVTVSFKSGVGEQRHAADGQPEAADGHYIGLVGDRQNVPAGQTLEVNGSGRLVVTAETFHADFNALPAAS